MHRIVVRHVQSDGFKGILLVGDSVPVLSAARIGFSQRSKHRHYRIALEFTAMRAGIAYERVNELQRHRLLRRTSAHNPVPLLIGEHREVLACIYPQQVSASRVRGM